MMAELTMYLDGGRDDLETGLARMHVKTYKKAVALFAPEMGIPAMILALRANAVPRPFLPSSQTLQAN